MRKLTQLVLLSVTMLATPAFAEMKVAVLNYQMALLESDAAKRYAVDAEKKFGPQLNKLKTLESDAKRIQDRLVKGGVGLGGAHLDNAALYLAGGSECGAAAVCRHHGIAEHAWRGSHPRDWLPDAD